MGKNADQKVSEVDEIKLIYHEILNGYSFDVISSFFVKHFSEKENYLLLKKRMELFYFYSNQGVPHESELLKRAIDNGDWTPEKEDQILELKYLISDNEKNLANIIPQQRSMIEKIIDTKKNELHEILYDRKHTLGRNIEDLVDEDINDYISYLSFYKDEKCLVPVESDYETFLNWEPDKVAELNISLSNHYSKFSEDAIKGAACMPFFLNKFSYAKDNFYIFLGKPINEFTHHQSLLFSMGARNIGVLQTAKGSPPDLTLDAKIADVVRWYDLQHSLEIGRRNKEE